MFRHFEEDRPFIENKFHKTDEPFNAYRRMAYHGWECDPATGLDDKGIIEGLKAFEKEIENLPHPVAKAKAVEWVLENTRIDVNEHDYFIAFYTWNREIQKITCNKWYEQVFNGKIPEVNDVMNDFNTSGAVSMWPDFDHVVPDWDSLMRLGFVGILNRAREYRRNREEIGDLNAEQKAFFDGIEIEYTAIIRFVERLCNYACQQKHEKAPIIAECLLQLSKGAPVNIYEAMQLIYLYFMVSESVDCYQVRSLGNGLDNTLYSFYVNDLKNGTFTHDEIREFLAYFLMQWSAIGNYWGQPFYMGGTDENGNSKFNALSEDIADVYSELGIYNPKIQIKVNYNTPTAFLNKIFDMIRNGNSSFVFCCEPGMMKAVMGYGASLEEARTMDIRGCYETGVRANEVSSVAAYVNALKSVVYVFTDGFDSQIGKQIGIKTGEDFKTFEDFYTAVLAQWEYLIEKSISTANKYEKFFGEINPSSLYSGTIVTTLENARDGYQNGVKFNNSSVLCCGLASLVDSVMAVKEIVFEKREATFADFKKALENNWNGYEALRAEARNCRHKYGNGDCETDIYAAALSRWYCLKVNNRPNARGGVYKAILHSAMQFVWQGKKTEATPDGRMAGDEMSKNASPSVGMDRNGVTALINSSLKLIPYLYTESFCLDVMLHPSAAEGFDGLCAMKALLDTYMKNGGMSIQFNIFNAEKLRDAQKNPEKYKNLQVRVCGWNVLWNNLSREEQDSYILRAENVI